MSSIQQLQFSDAIIDDDINPSFANLYKSEFLYLESVDIEEKRNNKKYIVKFRSISASFIVENQSFSATRTTDSIPTYDEVIDEINSSLTNSSDVNVLKIISISQPVVKKSNSPMYKYYYRCYLSYVATLKEDYYRAVRQTKKESDYNYASIIWHLDNFKLHYNMYCSAKVNPRGATVNKKHDGLYVVFKNVDLCK